MLALPDDPEQAPKMQLSEFNLGLLPMVNEQSRLQRRFYEEAAPMEAVRGAVGKVLDADAAFELGLVTAAPDDIDWDRRNPHGAGRARRHVARRAHRPGSQPAFCRRKKTWPRASLAASPPGRTGFSSVPTPWVKRVP